ncbi:hypothetical protein ABMC89_10405 [Sulfitobacter sp. HNIBRBA3233]|uniref:hypothetical protein n=1 Tax=Sulfitobacter marinivivus TaxID=3158558 RepID=UPI0032DE80FB
MLDRLLAHASHRASHAAGSAAIGLGAGILLFVGLGFWTAAGWIFLISVTTALNAALIMGSVFFGAALIGFAIVAIRRRNERIRNSHSSARQKAMSIEQIILAFVTGMTAGSRTRSSKR